jgi:hypothetical protein
MRVFLSDRMYGEVQSEIQERRKSSRFGTICPVIYGRMDERGRQCDQKPSRCVNVSTGGVKLQSSFLVGPEEILDTTMALENRLVPAENRLISFMGRVTYLIASEDREIELGLSIQEIADQDREKLLRFIKRIVAPGLKHEEAIIQKGKIVCPACGKQIDSVARVKCGVGKLKRFWDDCPCGQRYEAETYGSGRMILCFPERRVGVVS